MNKPIDQSLDIARENLDQIFTVTEWAKEMNYRCPKYFSRKFRNNFGTRPKTKLIQLRIEKFFELINTNKEISCYEIALELGLKDEVAVNKFIKRHTGKPPSKWKNG